ncbi:unnamed protein product [Rotaria sp. Silwood1]|nr:unnamed protein product [Rotaria sp. Silwood1]CAF1637342.1 unnamed protein product [Rotaria sp. Silwood1]
MLGNQITGKLEAVGDTVEPFHFILHPKDEQYLTREDQDKGKELYSLLVQFEILQGDTIRKIFRNNSQERDKIEKIIRNDLDPSIADPLISLLNNLPFTTKEEEGNNIRIYQKEKNILKSGGLAKYKYGDIKRNIERILNKILKNTQFENDKELILSKILSLQGDIRSFKKGLKANLKDFIDLQDQENVPVAFGLTQIGNALISEGVSNMAGLSGTFSWKEWAIQKAISFGLSMLTAGIGKFLTDKIMEQFKKMFIQKIVSKIEENLLKGIIGLINNKVETLYLQKITLGKDILLLQQFDNIRT